jgi:hypothetical protein
MKRGRPLGSRNKKEPVDLSQFKPEITRSYNGWYSREHDDGHMRVWQAGWPGDTFDIISNDDYANMKDWHFRLTGVEIRFLDLHDAYEPGDNKA